MKRILFFVFAAALFGAASAGVKCFNIRDFGAREDATPAENAKAIQKAIDAAGGGRVIVPKGTWVSGTIWLKSQVDLHLEKGAVLKASPDLADYNAEDAYPENFGCPKEEYWRGLHFIICHRQEYVAITGEGEINGNGDVFFDDEPKPYYDWMKPGAECWWNGIRWAKDKKNLRPGQLVVFVKTNGITVKGITIRNSPCWSLFFHGCSNVEVFDYTVRNGMNDGNTDGVDVDCCQNVTMRNLDIDTGDDAIAIRASGARLGLDPQPACENVRISKAKLRSTSSVFRIGVGQGEIKNVVVEDIQSDRGGTAINMNTLYGPADKYGVDMSDVTFRNCTFDNCRSAYALVTAGKALKYGIRNVTFDGVRFTGPDGKPQKLHYRIEGEKPIENVVIVDPDLKDAVAADMKTPVRPPEANGGAFWNGHAEWFMYPPEFDFKPVKGAVKYRFRFVLDGHEELAWETVRPTDCIAPVWEKIPECGFVTVFAFGLDASGAVCGLAGERTFFKTARYKPGMYPKAPRSYAQAAAMTFDYLFDFPNVKHFLKTGKPDPAYKLNCYPSKMHASLIRAMVACAKRNPARAADAIKVARAAADFLLAGAEPADAPLAHFTQTYAGRDLTSGAFAGQHMLLYPMTAASAFLKLYDVTQEKKYLDGALAIAETYLKLQGEDGTWYLKAYAKDGKPVAKNRMFPIDMCSFFEGLYDRTKDARYRAAADRAFAYVEKGPLSDWNWEGQFEDVNPTDKYVNLTKHPACSTAMYLLKRFPGDAKRVAQARELLRWSEDQFVAWEPACRKDGTGFRMTGKRPGHFNGGGWDWGYAQWLYPSVMEQYYCYVPIDASAAKMIRTYLALYKATGSQLDLAKARTLGDSACRIQTDKGRIATFWHGGDLLAPERDWYNCMVSIAEALEQLAAAE